MINIGPGMPSHNAINANAHALARYAALCQEAGIVPIVEPEVLMDGPVATHDIDTCYAVTEWTLKTVFQELYYARVSLDGMVLKPNMVVPGKKCPKQASPAEVAEKTVKLLKNCVPPAVPGIAFLSGGQSDELATEHLSLMNAMGRCAVEAHLLLRPRPPGGGAQGLGRQGRERRRRPEGLPPPCPDEQPRRDRHLEGRSREKGGLSPPGGRFRAIVARAEHVTAGFRPVGLGVEGPLAG